jgi:hypothetical protein
MECDVKEKETEFVSIHTRSTAYMILKRQEEKSGME